MQRLILIVTCWVSATTPSVWAGSIEYLGSQRSAEARVVFQGPVVDLEQSSQGGTFQAEVYAEKSALGELVWTSHSVLSRQLDDRIITFAESSFSGSLNSEVEQRTNTFSSIEFQLDLATPAWLRADSSRLPGNLPIQFGSIRLIQVESGEEIVNWGFASRPHITFWGGQLEAGTYLYEIDATSVWGNPIEIDYGWTLTVPSPASASCVGVCLLAAQRRRR